MKYKYMEADVKEAKRLAEEHKDMLNQSFCWLPCHNLF